MSSMPLTLRLQRQRRLRAISWTAAGTSKPDGLYHLLLHTAAAGMQDLGAPSAPTFIARINEAGQIAGSASMPNFHTHAIRYTPGFGILDFHPFSVGSSSSFGINDRVYTIGIACTDASGNATRASVTVNVPHGSGGQ